MASHKNSIPPLSRWISPKPTKEDLDFVKLVDIDLSKFENQSTRKDIAKDLLYAVTEHGFFTISNHGIPTELWDQQMDVANTMMRLEQEQKKPFEATPEEDAQGIYVGFKPSGELGLKGGFHSEIDHYNVRLHELGRPHPPIMQAYQNELRQVIDCLHNQIHRKLLILVATVLEVPEQVLLDMHRNENSTTNYYRYMGYFPRSSADRKKARDLFLPGHADWSTFSILFSQPISALQILDKTNSWKWVQYIPHRLVVNVGEALELLTGGLFKATIHRVVTPPKDQADNVRIGILFFTRPNDDKLLEPISQSPYLQRMGLDQNRERVIYPTLQFLQAKKNGYRNKDVDFDRPKDLKTHADPFNYETDFLKAQNETSVANM